MGLRVSRHAGIAGWVARNGKPLIVNDVRRDSRFNKIVDRATRFMTRSVMCAPLVEGGTVVGVIEVVNKMDGTDFSEHDLEGLVSIAHVAVLPICFCKGEEARKRLVALALGSRLVDVRMKAIDALVGYGECAILDILKIVDKSITPQVKTHGLVKIEEITKKSLGYRLMHENAKRLAAGAVVASALSSPTAQTRSSDAPSGGGERR